MRLSNLQYPVHNHAQAAQNLRGDIIKTFILMFPLSLSDHFVVTPPPNPKLALNVMSLLEPIS